MKLYQSAVNCLLVMAMIAVALSACASGSTVKPDVAEQPLLEQNVEQDNEHGAAIVKSLALVDLDGSDAAGMGDGIRHLRRSIINLLVSGKNLVLTGP